MSIKKQYLKSKGICKVTFTVHASESNGAQNVHVVGEIYSKILNPKDFSTFPYFGDGSGSILFTALEEGPGVLGSILAIDGSGHNTICIPGGGTMLPLKYSPNAAT